MINTRISDTICHSCSTSGKEYNCRTGHKTKLKVTDFVVGIDLRYAVNGNKAKLKSLSGRQVDCTIVRVANAAPVMK
jgi:hypothetical protein